MLPTFPSLPTSYPNRFTVKYFGSSLGFFVEAINDVYGNFALDQSYWMILDGENSPTPVGEWTRLLLGLVTCLQVPPSSLFRFSASYDHSGHPGFFVNAFNDVYSRWEQDGSWWQILDGDLQLTPVGTRLNHGHVRVGRR